MILEEIVESKRKRLVEHKARIEEKQIKEMALSCNRKSVSFFQALANEGLSIIGEFKKASPSMGIIQNKLNLTDRIEQYNQAVDAISCLTEEDYFNGNIEYLKQIRKISTLPILRKDFIIDAYQIYEAKVIGADAILLIAAILNDKELKTFYDLAYQLGLDVLLEVHQEEELERAIKLGAKIVGINNRNLKDFTIQLETTKRLSEYLDKKLLKGSKRPIFVSESGISKAEDIAFLKEYRVDALLIGRAFMESQSPKQLAKEWKQIFVNGVKDEDTKN